MRDRARKRNRDDDEAETAAFIKPAARRINSLARAANAKSYLEIGVSRGATFFAVEIPRRVGVDPAFRFDARAKATGDTRLFEMTSDDWFVAHSRGETFDVIFLDGLHTFEQTFRDFCNSLAVAHDRTVWVIDDTVPSDIYSAWPDQKEAATVRRESFARLSDNVTINGKLKGGWHGDVFKVVFAIHDFFPTLSYCTIMTGGNPQTLVWRTPRTAFAPLFNSLEAISRLTFFDFRRRFDEAMQAVDEEEGLRRAGAFLEGREA